ncbi:hypothetical protein FIA58_007625 [Flavobacterium jejuense]|uniref:Uncharacterized protein n=1 Tax=Flavobacterium jejuense TaxID=1544455 RepID=A0ABX0ISR4_9FLAO|nr:hypothetical protein [Flavobacterium jejuense]NHN25543.1 hypothetical protein [Flavobacterium jejuense]
MKHTKEQIIEKAKNIMKDLDGKFYFEDCIIDAFFSKDKVSNYSKYAGKKHSSWIIGIKAIADNEDLLFISDETGEPIYYMNFNTKVFDIENDQKGYFRVGLPRD